MAYTPQELAALQAGVDPRAYFTDQMAAARAGLLDPESIQRGATPITPGSTLPLSFQQRAQQAQGFAQNALTQTRTRLGQAGPAIMARRGYGRAALGTGLLAGVPEAISELQQGRPVGAAGALGGGLALGGIGAAVSMIPHPVAKLAGAAIPLVGGLLGAPSGAAVTAESVRQSVTGEPTKGREGEYSTERARAQQLEEDRLSVLQRELGINTSNIKDLSQFYSEQQFLDLQRMNPLIQKMKNADMIRQQALMNTQGQIYSKLGILATAGKLATGAQAETGATVRQALASNPYASMNLQSPGISFG